MWPLAIIRRPLLITHQTWLGARRGRGRWLAGLKRLACAFGYNVFISSALARAARLPGPVIPNAYDDRIFHLIAEEPRDRDVAFLGRLVADKGADVLIDALAILAAQGIRLCTTVIGDGPERGALIERAAEAGVTELVTFFGPVNGPPLARELNRHRILVVPSRWDEPFGIVALEGAACGCVVVGTSGGGLPEAIGPCGPIVPNADPAELARCLATLAADNHLIARYRRGAADHLARHTPVAIVEAYEQVAAQMFCQRGAAFATG
jgi:glycogen(starch) synthase